jgi:hypothetical protein
MELGGLSGGRLTPALAARARVPLLSHPGYRDVGVPGSLVGDHRFTTPEDRHE